MADGVKNSQPGIGAIPRQKNDFNVLPTRFIQAEQFARQLKGNARLQQIIFVINLVPLIRLDAVGLVHRMALTQVKQRPRRNRNDQPVIDLRCHGKRLTGLLHGYKKSGSV